MRNNNTLKPLTCVLLLLVQVSVNGSTVISFKREDCTNSKGFPIQYSDGVASARLVGAEGSTSGNFCSWNTQERDRSSILVADAAKFRGNQVDYLRSTEPPLRDTFDPTNFIMKLWFTIEVDMLEMEPLDFEHELLRFYSDSDSECEFMVTLRSIKGKWSIRFPAIYSEAGIAFPRCYNVILPLSREKMVGNALFSLVVSANSVSNTLTTVLTSNQNAGSGTRGTNYYNVYNEVAQFLPTRKLLFVEEFNAAYLYIGGSPVPNVSNWKGSVLHVSLQSGDSFRLEDVPELWTNGFPSNKPVAAQYLSTGYQNRLIGLSFENVLYDYDTQFMKQGNRTSFITITSLPPTQVGFLFHSDGEVKLTEGDLPYSFDPSSTRVELFTVFQPDHIEDTLTPLSRGCTETRSLATVTYMYTSYTGVSSDPGEIVICVAKRVDNIGSSITTTPLTPVKLQFPSSNIHENGISVAKLKFTKQLRFGELYVPRATTGSCDETEQNRLVKFNPSFDLRNLERTTIPFVVCYRPFFTSTTKLDTSSTLLIESIPFVAEVNNAASLELEGITTVSIENPVRGCRRNGCTSIVMENSTTLFQLYHEFAIPAYLKETVIVGNPMLGLDEPGVFRILRTPLHGIVQTLNVPQVVSAGDEFPATANTLFRYTPDPAYFTRSSLIDRNSTNLHNTSWTQLPYLYRSTDEQLEFEYIKGVASSPVEVHQFAVVNAYNDAQLLVSRKEPLVQGHGDWTDAGDLFSVWDLDEDLWTRQLHLSVSNYDTVETLSYISVSTDEIDEAEELTVDNGADCLENGCLTIAVRSKASTLRKLLSSLQISKPYPPSDVLIQYSLVSYDSSQMRTTNSITVKKPVRSIVESNRSSAPNQGMLGVLGFVFASAAFVIKARRQLKKTIPSSENFEEVRAKTVEFSDISRRGIEHSKNLMDRCWRKNTSSEEPSSV